MTRSRSSTVDRTGSFPCQTPSFSTSACPPALRVIDGGHFIWEEAPAEYAAIVLDSITR
jgi:pimeloyl-ACP methyl ester carboxylesterase